MTRLLSIFLLMEYSFFIDIYLSLGLMKYID